MGPTLHKGHRSRALSTQRRHHQHSQSTGQDSTGHWRHHRATMEGRRAAAIAAVGQTAEKKKTVSRAPPQASATGVGHLSLNPIRSDTATGADLRRSEQPERVVCRTLLAPFESRRIADLAEADQTSPPPPAPARREILQPAGHRRTH